MIDELSKIGYKSFYKILNATYFGVPQARKRIYIVAFRNDLNFSKFIFPEKKGAVKSLEDIMIKSYNNNYFVSNRNDVFIDAEDDTKKQKDLLIRIGKIGKGRQGERIYSIKGQAVTLSSQGGGVAGKTGMYYINGKIRKLMPRECARLMGFPDNYKLDDIDSKSYKQLGNSVVINVLQEIILNASYIINEKEGK